MQVVSSINPNGHKGKKKAVIPGKGPDSQTELVRSSVLRCC